MLGVEKLLDRYVQQISGGEQQRVAIGRAIVQKPNLYLLDEPISNLDASLRETVRTEVRRLQRQLGATMIMVTHDQMDALAVADRIAVLGSGVLRQIGTPEELYQRPANLFVAGLHRQHADEPSALPLRRPRFARAGRAGVSASRFRPEPRTACRTREARWCSDFDPKRRRFTFRRRRERCPRQLRRRTSRATASSISFVSARRPFKFGRGERERSRRTRRCGSAWRRPGFIFSIGRAERGWP